MPYDYKRQPLTQEEMGALEGACKTGRDKLIVWTLLDTGLRVSEFVHLRKEMVEWAWDRIGLVGKGGKRRVVPITARVKKALESMFALSEGKIEMSKRTAERAVTTLGQRAGITKKITPHVLRHTFAVQSLRRGISLPSLQKILGHSNLTTTAIYLNMSPEEALREYKEKW